MDVNTPEKPKRSHRQTLAKSAWVIGSWTFLSRIMGFVRDILIATFFGTGPQAEAFVVSFKLPNLFRDLAGEGAMNAAIVPVLTETRTLKGDKAFWQLALSLFVWFTAALLLICALGILFAPWVIKVIAPGFQKDPEKFLLTTELTRLIFPFIVFIGLSALMMGVLNTLKSFGTSAVGPSLLNISMVACLVVLGPYWPKHDLVFALGVAILIGGVLQCLVQIPSFMNKGMRFIKVRLYDDAVKKIFKLLIPRVWGTAVYQISVFVDTILASFYWIVGDGGQSALYYSSRIFQLPLAIFGIAMAQAALPTFSGQFAKKDMKEFKETFRFALRGLLFLSIPAAIGLAVFSDIIVDVLFKRGEFTEYSAHVTSQALFFYSLGLLSCIFIKMFVTAFYALQDTMSPVKTASVGLAANIILNFCFMWHLKIGGLALATSLAATLNAILLYILLRRKTGTLGFKLLRSTFWKPLVAGSVMAGVCWFVFRPWILNAADISSMASMMRLAAAIAASVLIYYVSCLGLGSEEAKNLRRLWISSRP